ncbi:hypothetical protein DY000_02033506 [Brassica cretica]|uniref:Uncharacterized protein n=1 Tax=Brassica cretica TaxID=69181 RepID=A0ABQ7DFV0_BRACR|nr:hypothetical protein DY000_02033506 [Brassica cretica]
MITETALAETMVGGLTVLGARICFPSGDIGGNNDYGNGIGRDDGWWFNGGDKSCPASSNYD